MNPDSGTLHFHKQYRPSADPDLGCKTDHHDLCEEFAESSRDDLQKRRIVQWHYFVEPTIDAYYKLEPEQLGRIKLPNVTLPTQPPDDASYDEKQEYLVGLYRATLRIALPSEPLETAENTAFRPAASVALSQHPTLHQPLPIPHSTSSIRLLELLPGSTQDYKIVTRLVLADLNAIDLHYEVLSYAEELQPKSQSLRFIDVNGETQKITPSLYGALSDIRLPSQKRVLWIDSICINRDNPQERTQQTVLMAKIYGRASRLVVHIGPSSPSSRALFKFLDGFESRPESNKIKTCIWDAVADAGFQEQPVIDGFLDICTRTWWKRLWILQACTLNAGDHWIYCGRCSVSAHVFYDNFPDLYTWVVHRTLHTDPDPKCPNTICIARIEKKNKQNMVQGINTKITNDDKELRLEGQTDILSLPSQTDLGSEWRAWGEKVWQATLAMKHHTHYPPWSTKDFLRRSMDSECLSSHDMVYGVRELMEPVFRDLFTPDYTLPISTLFTRLSAYMLIFDIFPDVFWYHPQSLGSRLLQQEASMTVPSWVPDFTKRRVLRDADQVPDHDIGRKIHPYHEPRILDRVLFMDGWCVDEIVQVFPLPANDPCKLLQQLWYVEKLSGNPTYLQVGQKAEQDDNHDASQRYQAMLGEHGSFTPYPSVAWATRYKESLPTDISIVELLATKPNFDTLSRKVRKFAARVPGIVDLQIANNPGKTVTAHERQGRIDNMEARLVRLCTFLLQSIRAEFVGICAFDSPNFRAQVLHRLVLVNEETLPLPEGEPRRVSLDSATTQRPILYDHIIEAIEEGSEDDEELKLRELLVVWLISKIQETVETVVGQEGERLFPGAVDERAAATVFEYGKEKKSTIHVIAVPMSTLRPNERGKASFWLRTISRDGDGKITKIKVTIRKQPRRRQEAEVIQINLTPPNRELINEPPNIRRHLDPYFPNTAWERWRYVRQVDRLQVDAKLVNIVEFLAGRELFITASGFVGLTSPGTQGVRDGDELLAIKGMSFPLIGRLAVSTQLREPKMRRSEVPAKGMSREIVGTAVVKDLDLNGRDADTSVWVGDHVPSSGTQIETMKFI